MSPRFDPDLASTHATTPIYDRGEYCVAIVGRTPFAYEKEDDKTGNVYTVAGVRFQLEMVGPVDAKGNIDESHEDSGEDVMPYRMYVHTKKAFGFTKRVLMAMCGYTREDEDLANEELFTQEEWWVEGADSEDEDATCGSGYDRPVGNRAIVTLDKNIRDDREQQEFSNWRPIS